MFKKNLNMAIISYGATCLASIVYAGQPSKINSYVFEALVEADKNTPEYRDGYCQAQKGFDITTDHELAVSNGYRVVCGYAEGVDPPV